MKTVITTFFCLIIVATSFAQNKPETTEHMKFKGVPIDGTLNEYVSKMKKSGFTLIGTKDGVAMLKGDFAAYKDCIIGIATLKGKDLVNKIIVVFPKYEIWSALSFNYYSLKELLTEKYGVPSKIVEKFDTNYEPEDDNSKMYEVGMNRCKYFTTYETKNGIIQLSIENGNYGEGFVMLSYFDKINSNIIREKAKEDL